MPKKTNKTFWGGGGGGGRGRSNNPEDKHFFGHDDRTTRCHESQKFTNLYKPRVSFKKTSFKDDKMDKFKRKFVFKRHLADEAGMPASSNNNPRIIIHRGNGRGKPFFHDRSSPMPHGIMRDNHQQRHHLSMSDSNWYRVSVVRGQKLTKDFVLNNLLRLTAPLAFTPIMYKIIGADAVFFVEDHKLAMKLADCDRRITNSDGIKIQIKVRPGVPPIEISDTLKERLKLAMGKRYVQDTNALDLSKFHCDPDLAGDYWCPLARPNMFSAVIDLVQQHIPNLGALNLDSNKLLNIEKLGILGTKLPNLKILYIGDNKIKEINSLNILKNLQLEELRLEGNPVCNKYKNRNDEYISDIRKRFPKLLKLDGVELPPPIVFDVEDHKRRLPSTQKIFVVQASAQDIVSQFLQQYFMVFDSENRQPLLDAYHENACFSMTSTVPPNTVKFTPYLMENRNILRVMDSNRRRKSLKQGRLPVVSFISELPRTEHDLASFTLDLSLVTDVMLLITITGFFKEFHHKDGKEILRYFNRTFMIVPEGSGFCISNEQLHINNATLNQEKQINKAAIAPSVTPGPSSASSTVCNTPQLSEEIKHQMTISLSQQTNMNLEWSLKCLEEVQWNFENARTAFQEAFSLGKIPSNAFTK